MTKHNDLYEKKKILRDGSSDFQAPQNEGNNHSKKKEIIALRNKSGECSIIIDQTVLNVPSCPEHWQEWFSVHYLKSVYFDNSLLPQNTNVK